MQFHTCGRDILKITLTAVDHDNLYIQSLFTLDADSLNPDSDLGFLLNLDPVSDSFLETRHANIFFNLLSKVPCLTSAEEFQASGTNLQHSREHIQLKS
jgi:hypothetical protein